MLKKVTFKIFIFIAVSAFAQLLFVTCYAVTPEKFTGQQLYSVREAMTENPESAVTKLDEMGYKFVKATGYSDGKFYGMEPTAFKEVPSVSAADTVEYDPNTTVYCDALWFRVHAENCPELILKEKTMTLEEADKAGYRIGESGQSGRNNCCFQGYQRKYPEKTFTDDTILYGDDRKDSYKHVAGCHRYWPDRTHMRRTLKEWVADGFNVCPHCIERGPSLATISDEEWNKLPSTNTFVPPEGWEPKSFSTDKLPPKEEVEILIQETLAQPNGIQELQFTDPVASMENFVTMRFFFPVHNWLDFYKAYRATGDKRLLDKLLESARHYNKLSTEYPTVAQAKASDPEGMPFMYSMAACARITLQLAQKQPSAVSTNDIAEAETFLNTMVSVLEPTCEGTNSLDPEMGIPQKLADDFRYRAFNRSMNGIGTLSMATAALEDLQALKKTKEYQPTIDRYRKVIQEFIKNWFSIGHLCKFDGENHFYYPYSPRGEVGRKVDGCVIFKRAEDVGHYSHTMQGLMCLYESMPELGIDDRFLTAVANAIYHNATTEIRIGGKKIGYGYIECPTQSEVSPTKGGHLNDAGPARDRFYMLQAFRNDMIDGLCDPLNKKEKAAINSEYAKRLATLHAQYMKALRKDPSLIHLGEKM